jgi:tetratricopeptide (TPR) repeat protein
MRTAQVYRQLYITLADYFINQAKNNEKAAEVLSVMRKKILEPPVTFDLRTKINTMLMYTRMNKYKEIEKYGEEIEAECLANIEKNPKDVNSQENPYQILIGVYELLKKYDKEIEVFNKLLVIYPNDPGIKSRIEQLKVLASQNVILDSAKK